jgi:hypothetical protein
MKKRIVHVARQFLPAKPEISSGANAMESN